MRTLAVKQLCKGEVIDEGQFFKWLDALRSGKFPQGKGRLQGADGYCCLGVACQVLMPKLQKNSDGFMTGGMPYQQPNSPKWLGEIDTDIRKKKIHMQPMEDGGTPSVYHDGTGLTELNDKYRYTFNDIADVLELIYVHGAAEGELV